MDALPSLGRGIAEVIPSTYQLYGDILRQESNVSFINQAQPETFSYGTHERQKLDLYTPSDSAPKPALGTSRPILVFLYGGGFVNGDRILASIPRGLVYRNFGYFFSEKLGYETLVMDYRLQKHGAKLQTGGEDICDMMKWVAGHYGNDGNQEREVFLMGTSAGSVHVTTWLFGTWFKESREASIVGKHGVKLSGIIILGCPCYWDASSGALSDVLVDVYGGKAAIKENEPIALMRQATTGSGVRPKDKWPRILVLVAELDPEALMVVPSEVFAREWQSEGGHQLKFDVVKGHNHVSPPLGLGTHVEKEEKWGYELGKWIGGKEATFF